MIKKIFVFLLLISFEVCSYSMDSTKTFFNFFSEKAQVKKAIEVESLFPMFFFGGYHLGIGYRFFHFRLRASVIRGGSYDAEPAGVNNSTESFKRYYAKPGYGIFFGYNIWKNWETYSYIERHAFGIEQKATSEQVLMHSTDFGLGSSYQLFLGKWFYLQPGLHFYFRQAHLVGFSNGQKYSVPQMDISPVIRAGIRLWKIE
jgi:hypothetical protein